MAAEIRDDFVGSAGVLVGGHQTNEAYDWVAHQEGEGVLALDGAGKLTSPYADDALVDHSLPASQYAEVGFTLITTTSDDYLQVKLYLRAVAPGSYGWMEIALYPLHSYGAGGYFEAGNDGGGDFQWGDLGGALGAGAHTLRMECVGDAIDILVDGVSIVSYTEPYVPAAAGYAGILMDPASTSDFRVDYFEAGSLVQTDFPVEFGGDIVTPGVGEVAHIAAPATCIVTPATPNLELGFHAARARNVVTSGLHLREGAVSTFRVRPTRCIVKPGHPTLKKLKP